MNIPRQPKPLDISLMIFNCLVFFTASWLASGYMEALSNQTNHPKLFFFGLLILWSFLMLEVATLSIMGWYVGDKYLDWLREEGSKAVRLNLYNKKLLSVGGVVENTGIAPVPFSLISKYYIQGNGPVPRWSKSHKLIKELYAQARAIDEVAQTIITDEELKKML